MDSASSSDDSCIEAGAHFHQPFSHPMQQSRHRQENSYARHGWTCSGAVTHLVSFGAVMVPACCPPPGRGAGPGAGTPLPCLPGGAPRKALFGRRLVLLHAFQECRQSLLIQGLRIQFRSW